MTTSNIMRSLNETVAALPETWMSHHRGRTMTKEVPNSIAVVYGRYSTDKQSETSVERQVEICGEYIQRTGRTLHRVYADRAMSGSTTDGRVELDAMLEDARKGIFGVLVVENVDRLARNLAILSVVFKELEAIGVEIHQPGRGKLSITDIAFQGLMGDEGRRLLVERTSYAKLQMVRKGLIPHMSYGYTKVPGQPGLRTIVPHEAETVRSIFQLRLEGLNPMQIAASLNSRSIVDKTWTNGGIIHLLANPLYNGVLVFNQKTMEKNTVTGGYSVRMRPSEEWIVSPVPHMRIVDQDVWEAVQAIGHSARRPNYSRKTSQISTRSKYLLSGKVKCPECGGNMVVGPMKSFFTFRCSNRQTKLICQNPDRIRVDELESVVIQHIADNILDPGCTEAYVAAYNETREASHREYATTRKHLTNEVERLFAELDRTWDEDRTRGYELNYLAWKRQKLTAELQKAQHDLASLPGRPQPVGLEMGRMTMLREAVAGMQTKLPFQPGDEAGFRLASALRGLIKQVVARRTTFGSFECDIHLTILPLLDGSGHAPREMSDTLILHASYRRETKPYIDSEQARANIARLESGEFALRDQEWEAVRNLVPANTFRTMKNSPPWSLRLLIEAQIFMLMTGAPMLYIPSRFGVHFLVRYRLQRLSNLGIWRKIALTLTSLDPDRYKAELAEVTHRSIPGQP